MGHYWSEMCAENLPRKKRCKHKWVTRIVFSFGHATLTVCKICGKTK